MFQNVPPQRMLGRSLGPWHWHTPSPQIRYTRSGQGPSPSRYSYHSDLAAMKKIFPCLEPHTQVRLLLEGRYLEVMHTEDRTTVFGMHHDEDILPLSTITA